MASTASYMAAKTVGSADASTRSTPADSASTARSPGLHACAATAADRSSVMITPSKPTVLRTSPTTVGENTAGAAGSMFW